MKRCIKWLIHWIWLQWEYIVGFAISGLLGIALIIMIFVYVDTVPATPSDYEQLENQVNAIQQNPDLLLETGCNINGGIITVEFENDECKMVAKYDKDFEVLSTSKLDKSISWLCILIIDLFVGYFVIYFGGLILGLSIYSASEWILEIVRKLKAKF